MSNVALTPINWPLLGVPDAEGRLHYPVLEQSVRDAIKIILLTRKGEQLMRPRFGAGLDQFLHDPNTLTTRRRIRDSITEALQQWERRIDVDRVEVFEMERRPSHVRIEISYRIRRIGVGSTLGLTLEIGS